MGCVAPRNRLPLCFQVIVVVTKQDTIAPDRTSTPDSSALLASIAAASEGNVVPVCFVSSLENFGFENLFQTIIDRWMIEPWAVQEAVPILSEQLLLLESLKKQLTT